MTLLGAEVHAKLAKTWDGLELSCVEQILADSGIVDRSNSGVPVQLHITRVAFSGEKSLVMNDGGDAVSPSDDSGDQPRVSVPFKFDWSPAAGVNGVGSEKNLRGKSSVLKVISWALVGRSPLRADVELWISRVTVEFTIDGTMFAVRFNTINGTPNGNLVQCLPSGRGEDIQLGSFTSADAFEALMNSFMLERLRLEDLSVWAKDKMQPHAWPSYAGALNFFADQLDPLIGNVQSLSTRLLQMFAGTSWAPTVGQVNAALGRYEYESKLAAEKDMAGSEFAETQRADAETRVERAQSTLDALPTSGPDVASVFALLSHANDSARAAHTLRLQLMTARGALDDARASVRAELARRQAATEDKLARKFFNSMHPTECPRCSSKVTDEHREAEHAEHECSLCHAGLDLAAFDEQVLVSTDVSSDERARLRHAATKAAHLNDDDDDDSDVVDVLVALEQVADAASQSVEAIEADLVVAETDERATATSATDAEEGLAAAKERQQAEIELARAQGALESLILPPRDDEQDREDELTGTVLKTAKSIVDKWLKTDQDPILGLISEEIAQLAHQFGIGNLERVSLKGNANMTVWTGGVDEGYASISGGERIRLKIATAIALMRVGKREGVGRHPGLLFIDSPASEEIGESDLSEMLGALKDVAVEAGVQLFVATAHTALLKKVLSDESVRAADGDGYVW
ncbi:hypothetical protein [Leucobacter komagatae]|uniref:Uncharacterized protein n=1 Tax=Leucobacter komagatae TaxID=55969 RepID=A0A0D0IU48_9MICO|nr:hypothetical protein [Leucobacter komagatae]KIP53008.1 hypothetical protein SD72_05820 [Leucobacter komagatae]